MPTMGVAMHEVLKFPLKMVKRSTENKGTKCSDAKILFFTGIRYERHAQEERNTKLKTKEVAKKL